MADTTPDLKRLQRIYEDTQEVEDQLGLESTQCERKTK